MLPIRRLLMVLVCLLTVSPVVAASNPEAAVRAADQEWARVFAAKMLDASVKACAPDARVLAPNAPVAQGHEAIRQLFSGFFALPNLKIAWSPNDVRVAKSGDLAYSTGTYQMRFDGPHGTSIEDHGKYVTVWQKAGDGSWKVIADCFNSDLPMPSPESH